MVATKQIMTPRKKISSLVAIVMAATILFGGTFAWQSISQEALNEIRGGVNPGGRLHDDFDEPTIDGDKRIFDKDVYVENFTSTYDGVEIFARIRLDEYLEYGPGAGDKNADRTDVQVVDPTNDGKTPELSDRGTWTTFIPDKNHCVHI